MKYFIATNLPVNSRLYRCRNFCLRNSRLQIFKKHLQANIRYPVCQPNRSDLLRSFSQIELRKARLRLSIRHRGKRRQLLSKTFRHGNLLGGLNR